MPTRQPTRTSAVRVDRRRLLDALTRVGRVVPNHTCKPVLQGVRMEASGETLRLSATDLDVSLSTTVEAEGDLPACLVACPELAKRVKAGNADVCLIRFDPEHEMLTVNGGRVNHTVRTMDLKDLLNRH